MNAAAIVEAMLTPQGRIDPYPLYARAHELGAAVAIADELFLISGYAAVNQVLRNPGFGMADPGDDLPSDDALAALSQSILRTNPPEHRRMRSLISSVFTPRRVAGLSPAIETSVDLLLDGLSHAGQGGIPVDFMEEFAFQLPVSVICEMLGVPQSDRHRFRALAADVTVALELAPDADSLGPASAAAGELADYFTDLITDRRAARRSHQRPGSCPRHRRRPALRGRTGRQLGRTAGSRLRDDHEPARQRPGDPVPAPRTHDTVALGRPAVAGVRRRGPALRSAGSGDHSPCPRRGPERGRPADP